MKNWEICGEDRSWCSLRQYVGTGLEELRKTTTKLSLVGARAEIRTGRLVEELSDRHSWNQIPEVTLRNFQTASVVPSSCRLACSL